MNHDEQSYLDLIKRIMEEGEIRHGRNGYTKSVFGERLVFNLKVGFPLLTTKKVFWRGIVEELLWFLRGSTNVQDLQAKNIHFWDGNSSRTFLDSMGLAHIPTNTIGKGYGWQWRNFSGSDYHLNDGVDQLRYILKELHHNPHGRRAILNAWNPLQLNDMALPPCHFVYNFYLGNKGLSCQMIMRSSDVGAGLPFNIASTALFTAIIAHVLGKEQDKIIIVTGDTHLYTEHIESAKIQMDRVPLAFPKLVIKKLAPNNELSSTPVDDMITWIEALTYEDFEIQDYNYHPTLKYEMIV